MAKFRKKPTVIEAEQFFYDGPRLAGVFYPSLSEDGRTYIGDAFVITIHREKARLQNGDWVIAESEEGYYYPCKNDIFCATYEAVDESNL